MKVRVLYFARLREVFARESEWLEIPQPSATMADIVRRLQNRGGDWATALADGQALGFAINQQFADLHDAINDGDETAIFPPITGG